MTPLHDFGFRVRSHVVQDDVEATIWGVAAPDGLKETEYLLPSFSLFVMHPKSVFVDIVGRQEVAHSVESTIGRPLSDRAVLRSPSASPLGLHLDGAKLVKADDR